MAKTFKNAAASGEPEKKASAQKHEIKNDQFPGVTEHTSEPHPDTSLLGEVEAFLNERIADGGATPDHLRTLLNKIKPSASEAQNQHAAEAPPGTAPIV